MVQAPQAPTPQPNLVPVKPTMSRIAHKRGICGSASMVCSTPLILICDMGFSQTTVIEPGSFLQCIEIGNNILPVGLTGEIDEHLGAADETGRVCQEFVEIGVVPGDVRILHRGGEIEPWNRAALAPDNTAEGRPDLFLTGGRRMAYCAVRRKALFAGRRIAGGQRRRRRHERLDEQQTCSYRG